MILQTTKNCFHLLSARDKKRLFFFSFLMCVFGVFDFVLSIVIVPLIGFMTNQVESFSRFPYLNEIKENFELFVFFLIFLYIIRVLMNLLILKYSGKFSYDVSSKILISAFEKSLNLKIDEFYKLKFSNVLSYVADTFGQVSIIIRSLLNFIKEVLLVILISAFAIKSLQATTLLAIVFLVALGALLILWVNKKMRMNSSSYLELNKQRYGLVKSTVENISFFKILTSFEFPVTSLRKNTIEMAKNRLAMDILNSVPRNFYENIGLIFILILALSVGSNGNPEILYELSILGISFYKLVPSLQRLNQIFSSIAIASPYIENLQALDSKSVEKLGDGALGVIEKITLSNVDYEREKFSLNIPSLHVNKGDKVCIWGESGAGKSTLLSLLVGFVQPKNGNVEINEVNLSEDNLGTFRRKVSYVTQTNNFFPGTVADNIIFGRELNKEQMDYVIKISGVNEFIGNVYEHELTDFASNLSGGQKQRIALARALYSDFEILILDEATSALDKDLERKIIDNVFEAFNNKTIIAITHNPELESKFQKIIKVIDGEVICEG